MAAPDAEPALQVAAHGQREQRRQLEWHLEWSSGRAS